MALERLAAELIDDTSSAPSLIAARSLALQRIGSLVPFESAIFLSQPAEIGSPVTFNKPDGRRLYGLFRTAPAVYKRGLYKRGAARQHAYLDTEIFSYAERCKLPFYRDIVRPQGITSQIHVSLVVRGTQVGSIYLCRHGRVGAFRARDLELVRRMQPTLSLVQAAWTALGGESLTGDLTPASGLLTPRERAIAAYVARGLRNREIAQLLGTSPNTVRNQLARISAKLDLRGRAALAAWALRSGLA